MLFLTESKITLNEMNQWSGTFEDLDEYSGGNKTVYTMIEGTVEGYTCKVSGNAEEGYVIKNVHESEPKPEKPEETPKSPKEDRKVPYTGDTNKWKLWLAMTLLSGFALMLCMREKARKNR